MMAILRISARVRYSPAGGALDTALWVVVSSAVGCAMIPSHTKLPGLPCSVWTGQQRSTACIIGAKGVRPQFGAGTDARGRPYPFRPVVTIPWTKYFCATKKRIRQGNATINAAPMSRWSCGRETTAEPPAKVLCK